MAEQAREKVNTPIPSAPARLHRERDKEVLTVAHGCSVWLCDLHKWLDGAQAVEFAVTADDHEQRRAFHVRPLITFGEWRH